MSARTHAGWNWTRYSDWRLAKTLVVATVLLIAACDKLQRFSSGELSGSIFVRSGAGETKPQGGVEVRLLASAIHEEMNELRGQYQQRLKQRTDAMTALKNERAALEDDLARWRNEQLSKIGISIHSAKPDLAHVSLRMDLSVKNGTDIDLSSVNYKLLCDGIPLSSADLNTYMPLKGDVSVELILLYGPGVSRSSCGDFQRLGHLKPGATCREREHAMSLHENIVKRSERTDSFLSCPLERLSAIATAFGVYDPTTALGIAFNEKGTLEMDKFCHTKEAEDRRHAISELEQRLGDLNVADLDAALDSAIGHRTSYTTRTDINGHYNFEKLDQGKYVLYAPYVSAVDDTAWFVDVVVEGRITQDLSNFNFSDPRFTPIWKNA